MAEESKEKLNIRLHVYDEDIAMVLHNREDEQYYRAAAKLITERYGAYAQVYKGRKSDHTIALMTLIEIARAGGASEKMVAYIREKELMAEGLS